MSNTIHNADSVFEPILKKENEYFSTKDHMIMLTFDDNYIDQTINLILSIVRNQPEAVSFYCVCLDLSEANAEKLLAMPVGVQVRIYRFSYDISTGHWPKTTLLRVFSPWLLDPCVEKILYMDSDIICSGDLTALFEMDTPWIAMGNEISGNTMRIKKGKKAFFELHPASVYCNAGVTVLNLANIRAGYDFAEVFRECCTICESYPCFDQDFLNLFFLNKITYFNGLLYNFQPYELKGSMFYKHALRHCSLIHFSAVKPWKDACDRAIMRIYLKHSEYRPMRTKVLRAYRNSILKSPYTAVYKLLVKIKQKALGLEV